MNSKQQPVSTGRSGKEPPLWNNTISVFGMVAAAITVVLLATFALFALVSPRPNPYIDIVGYLVLPSMLIISLLIIPLGLLLKSWRLKRKDPTQRLSLRLRFDLSDPNQRRVAKGVIIGTFIFLPVVAVSSYHGYHYTDSAEFCGKACHSVMEPEATTYERSPHARVPCAECHIGEGAGWFVKSKLSGTRQVLAMWRESYSRPIAPAIHHLRPARETCEHCHWPQKFYGAQLKEIPHFAADEKNTRRDVTMLLKIGGGHDAAGPVEGIHWHMALANKIDYIAVDSKLQDIPYITMRDRVGDVRIYRSDGKPSSDPPPQGQLRTLDCMDCHNRPAHEFVSPQEAVDRMLGAGRIDTTLPFVKREAVRVLVQEYADVATAEAKIGSELIKFYSDNFPEVWRDRQASVNQTVDTVREIYRTNFFPYMRVDWQTYPDNVGHMYSPGCFRCHDGKHVAANGKALGTDCNLCHTLLERVQTENGETTLAEGKFHHPIDLGGIHTHVRCDQCHTGGIQPPPTCDGCHTAESDFYAGRTPQFSAFEIAADPMHGTVDCEGCHDAAKPLDVAAMNETCLDCHDDEPEKYDGLVGKWKKEVADLLIPLADQQQGSAAELVNHLRSVGPLHNIEATRKILKALAAEREGAPSEPVGQPGA